MDINRVDMRNHSQIKRTKRKLKIHSQKVEKYGLLPLLQFIDHFIFCPDF